MCLVCQTLLVLTTPSALHLGMTARTCHWFLCGFYLWSHHYSDYITNIEVSFYLLMCCAACSVSDRTHKALKRWQIPFLVEIKLSGTQLRYRPANKAEQILSDHIKHSQTTHCTLPALLKHFISKYYRAGNVIPITTSDWHVSSFQNHRESSSGL